MLLEINVKELLGETCSHDSCEITAAQSQEGGNGPSPPDTILDDVTAVSSYSPVASTSASYTDELSQRFSTGAFRYCSIRNHSIPQLL